MGSYRKALWTAALGTMVVGLFVLLALGLASRSPATSRSGETRVGKPAPAFSMALLDGGEFVLEEHLGRPLIMNFWASWCPPCRTESPGFERVWRRYRDQGVLFVGVNIQDTERDAADYVTEFDLTFPNGRDPDGKVTVEYGVVGLPVTFFIGTDGAVEGRWVGALEEERLEAWTRALIAGSPPEDTNEEGASDGFFKFR